MNDLSIELMKESLSYNRYLKHLNLSKNNLSNKAAETLSQILIMNNSITVLFLHWNKIQGKGAISLFKALEKNEILQVFDISFNTIGSDPENKVAKQLSSTCEENKGLVHLDISHCNFNQKDVEYISKILLSQYITGQGLNKNHTILGIHLLGNKAKIDAKGNYKI